MSSSGPTTTVGEKIFGWPLGKGTSPVEVVKTPSTDKVKTKPITIEDVRHAEGVTEVVFRIYKFQPASSLIAAGFVLLGIGNVISFLVTNNYLVHPFIALGLLVAGTGMLLTMGKASE